MLSLAILSASVLALFLTLCLFLWLGARWAGSPRSFKRAALTVIVVGLVLAGVLFASRLVERPIHVFALDHLSYPAGGTLLAVLQIVATGILSWFVVKLVFRISIAGAFFVWLAALLPAVAAIPITLFVLWPLVCEPVSLRSGSMCPTLLGRSQSAVCPHCGQVAYTPWITEIHLFEADGRLCTCSQCLQAHRTKNLSEEIGWPDRFMVNKLLTPRRWDLVLFRATHIHPSGNAPTIRYVKRIVGLPGEEVVIREGSVWIDGERLTPPADIAGLVFRDKVEDRSPILWGSADKPAKLGDEEYFVLGDYGYRSTDSRVWENQIEGYAPFALPASYIEGVVDLRFAPLARWHVFR